MTNKEAIKILKDMMSDIFVPTSDDQDDALDLAIKALEERPTGEWVREDNYVLCSMCNCGTHQPTLMGTPMFAFCPICGAKMKGEEE